MSLDEPDQVEFPYAGWVPTANGRLSFRHVGEARHPTNSIYANIATAAQRIVLGYQRRPLSDIFFQSLLFDRLYGMRGDFWFCIAARSDGTAADAEQIAGSIYIYKSKADWRRTGDTAIRSRVQSLNDLRLSIAPNRDISIETLYQQATEVASGTADISVEFCMERSGEVFFSRPAFRDSDLERSSIEYAQSHGQDFLKWMADQAYFFLRDLSHTHQHHIPTSDTILILQQRDAEGVRWRRNIIYSLHHYIIRSKRGRDGTSQYQAAGVLAYCSSFTKIAQHVLGPGFAQIPEFNNDALLASITARAQEANFASTEWGIQAGLKIARAANYRLFALALATIVIALLVMLVQPQIEHGGIPALKSASVFASKYVLHIVAVIVICLLVIWGLTHRNWQVKTKIGRDILEAANVRRGPAIIVFGILGTFLILSTLWLAQPALKDIRLTLSEMWHLFSEGATELEHAPPIRN